MEIDYRARHTAKRNVLPLYSNGLNLSAEATLSFRQNLAG